MPPILEERLESLKKLVAEQDKYNNNALNKNTESLILNEVLLKQQEPTVKALEN